MKEKKRPPGRPIERMSEKPNGRRVAELRRKGLSFGAIGAIMGMHRQQAHKIYQRVQQEKR